MYIIIIIIIIVIMQPIISSDREWIPPKTANAGWDRINPEIMIQPLPSPPLGGRMSE